MKFAPGDPVWAAQPCDYNGIPAGEHAAIVIGPIDNPVLAWVVGEDAYFIELLHFPPPSSALVPHWISLTQHLRPRHDGQTRTREPVGAWSECPWRPGRRVKL